MIKEETYKAVTSQGVISTISHQVIVCDELMASFACFVVRTFEEETSKFENVYKRESAVAEIPPVPSSSKPSDIALLVVREGQDEIDKQGKIEK